MVTISISVTDYEGTDFPEASHFPEWCAKAVQKAFGSSEQFGGAAVETECEGGALKTSVHLHGTTGNVEDLRNEILGFVKVDAWEAFCSTGYLAYAQ